MRVDVYEAIKNVSLALVLKLALSEGPQFEHETEPSAPAERPTKRVS